MDSPTPPSPDSIAALHHRMMHLPIVSSEEATVSEKRALAIYAVLQRTNLVLFERIEDSFTTIVDDLVPQLEAVPESSGLYVVRRQDIEAIVARAAIAATAQVAVDVAGELASIAEFNDVIGRFTTTGLPIQRSEED